MRGKTSLSSAHMGYVRVHPFLLRYVTCARILQGPGLSLVQSPFGLNSLLYLAGAFGRLTLTSLISRVSGYRDRLPS